MFRINSLIVTNFRSFYGTHEIKFATASGLYFLTGNNGIGKSSILDAITWALYGKSTRGLLGPDVVSRGESSCSVTVDLSVGNEDLLITTSRNPNSIKVNNVVTDREAVAKRLGLNFESFIYAIITPQTGDSFLDLSPGEKLALFSAVMDLDFWLEKSMDAAAKASHIETEKGVFESQVTRLNGNASEVASSIDELKVKSKEFDKKKDEKVEQLAKDLTKNNKEIAQLRGEIEVLEKALTAFTPQIQAALNELSLNEKEIKTFERELFAVDSELDITNHKIKEATYSDTTLSTVDSVCPTCRQVVDEKHLIKESKKLRDAIKELEGMKVVLIETRSVIRADKSKASTKASMSEIKLTKIKTEEHKAKSNRDALANEVTYLKREVSRLELEIKKNKEQVNDFTKMLVAKHNVLEQLNNEIKVKETAIARLHEEYAAVHFWVAAFKRLRLNIIEETLMTLEVEVNNNLIALGLGDWKIEFDIERENKSGGITKGFTTLITDPRGHTAKYETLSFGETQRVKLAGAFAFSNFLMERAGLVSHFEAYDECCVHMTAEGVEDTLNMLRDRAINSDKVVVLIDHNSIDYGDFAGTTSITKDEDGGIRIAYDFID